MDAKSHLVVRKNNHKFIFVYKSVSLWKIMCVCAPKNQDQSVKNSSKNVGFVIAKI
jgi:hypothetical protein